MGQGSQMCKAASISCDPFFFHAPQKSIFSQQLELGDEKSLFAVGLSFHASLPSTLLQQQIKWIISDKSTSWPTKLSVTKVGAMCWRHEFWNCIMMWDDFRSQTQGFIDPSNHKGLGWHSQHCEARRIYESTCLLSWE